MQSVLSRNWTRIAVSISCDDNHYTTGQQDPLLNKGDKGVNFAARLLEGGPAEAGGFSVSSLPWSIVHQGRMPDSQLNSQRKEDSPVLRTT